MIVSQHQHELRTVIAGVNLTITVQAYDGDPALARDFADQLANLVERKLERLGKNGAAENPLGHRVLAFPPLVDPAAQAVEALHE